jgi:hypothetical protein
LVKFGEQSLDLRALPFKLSALRGELRDTFGMLSDKLLEAHECRWSSLRHGFGDKSLDHRPQKLRDVLLDESLDLCRCHGILHGAQGALGGLFFDRPGAEKRRPDNRSLRAAAALTRARSACI